MPTDEPLTKLSRNKLESLGYTATFEPLSDQGELHCLLSVLAKPSPLGPEARAKDMDQAMVTLQPGCRKEAAAAHPLHARAPGSRDQVQKEEDGQVLGHPVQGWDSLDPTASEPRWDKVAFPQFDSLRAVSLRLQQQHHLVHNLHGQLDQLPRGPLIR